METNIQMWWLSQEVTQALHKYNTAIDGALAAAQKLEAISITSHLAEMFWCNEQNTAKMIQEDYLTTA